MIMPQDVSTVKDVVEKAKSAFVLLSAFPTYDSVASALSIYLSLKQAGKEVQIGCPADMRVEFSHLVGVDQILKKIGNRNLQVSFAYEEQAVEKVSYAMSEDGKRFNLIIAPKSGVKPLDPSQVEFSYTGAEADVVFIVGASQFEELEALYENDKKLFETAHTIAISPFPSRMFVKTALHTDGQSCMAEGVAAMLSELGMEPKEDVATNLLSSIEQATQRFQALTMSPETFEIVARLLRNGAHRSAQSNPAMNPQGHTSTPAFAQVLQARADHRPIMPMMPQMPQSMPPMPQMTQDALFAESMDAKMPVMPMPPMPTAAQPSTEIHQLQHTPADWTQPKVFTGATQV